MQMQTYDLTTGEPSYTLGQLELDARVQEQQIFCFARDYCGISLRYKKNVIAQRDREKKLIQYKSGDHIVAVQQHNKSARHAIFIADNDSVIYWDSRTSRCTQEKFMVWALGCYKVYAVKYFEVSSKVNASIQVDKTLDLVQKLLVIKPHIGVPLDWSDACFAIFCRTGASNYLELHYTGLW